MPDLGQLVILLVLLMVTGAVVVGPLLRSRMDDAAPPAGDDIAGLELRHRIAVESLRDVEADHRAGSLDAEAYQDARAEGEERAARTLAALEAAPGKAREAHEPSVTAQGSGTPARRVAALVGATIVALVLIGWFLPAPLTPANGTVVNAQLTAQRAAEAKRLDAIRRLETTLVAKPDAAGLVELANLYLQGGNAGDVPRAARLLIMAIGLDPKRADAYRLLITAYIQTGDYRDATAATEAYAKVVPKSADIPFFRGLIAYQGSGDRAAAVRWFDTFLRVAPDDPRAVMVRSLRAEAAGELPGSATPSPAPGS